MPVEKAEECRRCRHDVASDLEQRSQALDDQDVRKHEHPEDAEGRVANHPAAAPEHLEQSTSPPGTLPAQGCPVFRDLCRAERKRIVGDSKRLAMVAEI